MGRPVLGLGLIYLGLPLNSLFFSLALLSKEYSNIVLLEPAIAPRSYPVCPELPFVAPAPDRVYMDIQQARNIARRQQRGNLFGSCHTRILSLATVKLLIAILPHQFQEGQ
jgi:hypothetical protein